MSRRISRLLNPLSYEGSAKAIIIGIDVGTTFSGVSYAILRPGEVPEVVPVERFTDQQTGDNKIPSIMYYDKKLKLKAAGATACTKGILYDVTDQRWSKVEHFKMHLRPKNMKLETNGLKLGTLPEGLTPIHAMGDFLRYLYDETVSYIKNCHADGPKLWDEVKDKITFVLGHPNRWEGLPQQRMRQAALHGGLVKSEEEGCEKIQFVTEGEASALACLAGELRPAKLQIGYRFIVADAGGGTLDMSCYEITSTTPIRMKEIVAPDCRFAGSVFVNMKGRELLNKKLHGTQYVHDEILQEITDEGFEHAKKVFKDDTRLSYVNLGDRESNSTLNITSGLLKLAGSEMAKLFEFSIEQALQSIKEQIQIGKQRNKCSPMPVWLVGGFGTSPWLFKQLKKELVTVYQPEPLGAKAVANGAVLFAIEHPVSSRICKNTYGVTIGRRYNPSNPEHVKRSHMVYTSHSGETRISGGFRTMVVEDQEIEVVEKVTHSFFFEICEDEPSEASGEFTLYSYKRSKKNERPAWHDRSEDLFSDICTIKYDMEHLCQPSRLRTGPKTKYWRLEFDIELAFGTTEEVQARTIWKEHGQTKYGPATVFFDEYDCINQF